MILAARYNPPMDDLIRRARTDDREAWRLLFDACYPRMVAAIRDRARMQACDAEDLASEAFGQLVARLNDYDFETADSVRYYLLFVVERLAKEKRREARELVRRRPELVSLAHRADG